MNRILDITLAVLDILLLWIIGLFVIPRFLHLFAEMAMELPLLTQLMISFRFPILLAGTLLIVGITAGFQFMTQKHIRIIGNLLSFAVVLIVAGIMLAGMYLPVLSMQTKI